MWGGGRQHHGKGAGWGGKGAGWGSKGGKGAGWGGRGKGAVGDDFRKPPLSTFPLAAPSAVRRPPEENDLHASLLGQRRWETVRATVRATTRAAELVTRHRRCGTYIPRWALAKQAEDLFSESLDEEETSIADYCAPAHALAMGAALLGFAAQVVSFFLGRYDNSAWKMCLALAVGLLVALLDFGAMRYVILPWQEAVFELNIPVLSLMIGPVRFTTWLFASVCLTVMNTYAALLSAGNIGAIVIGSEPYPVPMRAITFFAFVLVNTQLFLTLATTVPMRNRYRERPDEGDPEKLEVESRAMYEEVVAGYDRKQMEGMGTVIKVVVRDSNDEMTTVTRSREQQVTFPASDLFGDDSFPLKLSITFADHELRVTDPARYGAIVQAYLDKWRDKGKLIRVDIEGTNMRKTVEKRLTQKQPRSIDDQWFPLTLSITFGERQGAAFQSWDRPRAESKTKEVRFSTFSHWRGWTAASWRKTHFEALVEWSRTAGLACCQGTFPSFPRAAAMEALFRLGHLDEHRRAHEQAANRARLIAEQAALFMLQTGMLKGLVQIALQCYLFCRKCDAAQRKLEGFEPDAPNEQDVLKLLFLVGLAVLNVVDMYQSTSKVYKDVHGALEKRAKEHDRAREAARGQQCDDHRRFLDKQWDFNSNRAFFTFDKKYSHMQIYFRIFVASILLLLGNLILTDLGPDDTMPHCVWRATPLSGPPWELLLLSAALALFVALLAYCCKRAKLAKDRILDDQLERIFDQTKGEGSTTADTVKLEQAAWQSPSVGKHLTASGDYLRKVLERYRPAKPEITSGEFHEWVRRARVCAENIEQATEKESRTVAEMSTEGDKDKEGHKSATDVFNLVDTDRSGEIDGDELEKMYQMLAKALGKKKPMKQGAKWAKEAFEAFAIQEGEDMRIRYSFSFVEFARLMERGRLRELRKAEVFEAVRRELCPESAEP